MLPTDETGEAAAQQAWVTADVVLLSYRDEQPHVLVIQRRWDPFEGQWALPGGHVDPGEDLEQAARRELTEETGLTAGRLVQIGAYGDAGRDPRGWYVTTAYVGVVCGLPQPSAADDAADARWVSVTEVRDNLAFDHGRILDDALALIEARGTGLRRLIDREIAGALREFAVEQREVAEQSKGVGGYLRELAYWCGFFADLAEERAGAVLGRADRKLGGAHAPEGGESR